MPSFYIVFLLLWPSFVWGLVGNIAHVLRTGGKNASGEPIRIYTTLAVDCCSQWSNYGRGMKQNYEVLIDWISENRGGVRLNSSSSGLRPLEVVIYNDYSSSELVTEIYEDMLQAGHRLFLSPYSSGLTTFSAAEVNKTNAVMVAPGAASPSVFLDRPRVFGTFSPSTQYMKAPFSAPAKLANTMMFVYEAASFTTSMCAVIPGLASQYNVSIQGEIMLSTTPSRESIKEMLENVRLNPPDMIVGCIYKAAGRYIIEEIAALEIEFKSVILSTLGPDDYNTLGRISEFVVGLTPWLPQTAQTSEVTGRFNPDYVAQYETKYAETPNYQGVSAQVALLAFVEAIEAAGSADPDAVVAALQTMNMQTIYGTVSFDENGQNINPLKGFQVEFDAVTKQSVLPVIAPQDVAARPLIYPMPSWVERRCLISDTQSPYGIDGSGACVECSAGYVSSWNASAGKRYCAPCGKGEQTEFQYDAVTEVTAAVCVPCPLGHGSSEVGQAKCSRCQEGRFANETGQTACHECNVGYANSLLEASRCLACPSGTFSESFGASECAICAAGRYSDAEGSSQCTQCPGDKVTFAWSNSLNSWLVAEGAKHINSCGCKVGFQPNLADTSCVECGDGLDCTGNGEVFALPGYASDGKLSTFQCRPNPKQCPGGPLGSCAAGRLNTSIGCSLCEADMTPSGDGTCRECGALGYFLATLASVVIIGILITIYFFTSSGDAFSASPTLMQIGVTLGQAVVMIQNLGVVSLVSIAWPSHVKAIFDVLKVFNFDIAMLRPECLTDVSAVGSYVSRLALIALSLVFILCIHTISVVVFHKAEFLRRQFVLVGSCGTVVMVFFISVVTTILTPFQCDGNPNGVFTLRVYPEVRCWEDSEHIVMIVIGGVATLVPLAFLAMTSLAIYRLPGQMANGNTLYLRTWAFMLVRFRPGNYWFSPILLLRNAVFGIASVFTRALVQVVWLECVLFVYIIAIANLRPWRVTIGNISDGFMTSLMLFIVGLTAFFVDDNDLKTLSDVMAGVIIVAICAIPVLIVLVICKAFARKRLKYHFFLCHHKLAAGASARLFKQLLGRQTGNPNKIFIDSDDLKNLTSLFDTVGHETEKLVVLHTADVLKRPWCMGEISVAHKKKVPIVIVMFPRCSLPSPEFIDKYESLVQGLNVLTEYAIDLGLVKEALRELRKKHVVNLPLHITKRAMTLTCKLIAKGEAPEGDLGDEGDKLSRGASISSSVDSFQDTHMKPSSASSSAAFASELMDGNVAIVADSENWEAVSTALVLHELMIVHLYQKQDKLPFLLKHGESMHGNVKDIVLICTAGMFHKGEVLEWLCQAAENGATSLPILADVAFQVPTPSIKAGIDYGDCSSPSENVREVMLQTFKEIGIVFQCSDAAGTVETLQIKAKEVATRLCLRGRVTLCVACSDFKPDEFNTSTTRDGSTPSPSVPLSGSLSENAPKHGADILDPIKSISLEMCDDEDENRDSIASLDCIDLQQIVYVQRCRAGRVSSI